MLNKPERKILRKMGYLSDQEGILKRYFREAENWSSHLDNCRDFIIKDLEERKPPEIAVLGSGWLLDFPLEESLEIVDKIYLVDIHHPRQVSHKALKSDKIEILSGDITGNLISEFYNAISASSKKGVPPDFSDLDFEIDDPFPENTFLISLNLLNQLDILLIDYLCRFERMNEKEILELRKSIQGAHTNWLSRHQGILISDIKEHYSDRQDAEGGLKSRKLVYVPLPSGQKAKNWRWKFDSNAMYEGKAHVEMDVAAISF